MDTEESRGMVLAMALDHSAPVRAYCAELIGAKQWKEGIPALVSLLNDRRDRNPTPGFFRGSRPDFHAARAAANSLSGLGRLDAQAISACLGFLRSRDRNSSNWESNEVCSLQ